MKPNLVDVIQSEESEESGMALADDEDLKKCSNPLLQPPKNSPKGHPSMAVYVAVGTKAIAEDKIDKDIVRKSPPVLKPGVQTVNTRKPNSLAHPVVSTKIPVAIKKPVAMKKLAASQKKLMELKPAPKKTVAGRKHVVVLQQGSETIKVNNHHPQMKVATMQIPLPEEEKYVQNIFDAFNDVSYGTTTEDDSTPPKEHPEEVYSVEFITDARQLADTHHRVQRLVAQESFSSVVEETSEHEAWLKELMSEAKAVLWHARFTYPLLEPDKRTTVISLLDKKKPMKFPLTSAFAQNLMQTLVSEVFDSGKMLLVQIGVRVPALTSPPPSTSGGDNYSVGIGKSVKVGQLCSTKSCMEPETCTNETCKIAKTLIPTKICGRQVFIDDRLVETLYRHMDWSDASASWSTKTTEGTPSAAMIASPSSVEAAKQPMTLEEPADSCKKQIEEPADRSKKPKTSSTVSIKTTGSKKSQKLLFTASHTLNPSSGKMVEAFAALKTHSNKRSKTSIPSTFTSFRSEENTLRTAKTPTNQSDRISSVKLKEFSKAENDDNFKPDQAIADQRFVEIPNCESSKKKNVLSSTLSSVQDKERGQLRASLVEPKSRQNSFVFSPKLQSEKMPKFQTKPTESENPFDDRDDSDLFYYRLIANMNQFPRSFRTSSDLLCLNCGYGSDSGQHKPCNRYLTKSTSAYRNRNRRP